MELKTRGEGAATWEWGGGTTIGNVWGMELLLQAFLMFVLDRGEGSASRPGQFNSGERAPSMHWIGGRTMGRTERSLPLTRIEPQIVGHLARILLTT
jgi:hypothetical protein